MRIGHFLSHVRRYRAVSACAFIACPTGRTAIASTTMPAHCWWPAPSTTRASSACRKSLTARFAAFIQHAWNPRHASGFATSWASIALAGGPGFGGQSRPHALGPGRMRAHATPAPRGGDGPRRCSPKRCRRSEGFRSPRAWSFTLLGLDAYCSAVAEDIRAPGTFVRVLADRLIGPAGSRREPTDWVWFEDGLAYDNARLPQALIVTGIATETRAYVDAGLRSLRWLMTPADLIGGLFQAGRVAELRRQARSSRRPSTSSRWRLRRRSRPAWPRGAPTAIRYGGPTPRGRSRGFWAATTCRSRWSIWKQAAAAMACIPTAPTRTAAASPWSPICSVSRRCDRLPA